MLKINRQTDYAVRVVLALAKRGEGSRLSSAEIQQEMLIPQALMGRIVAQLARAFLKDAPLLILDEPTSSLDPETESLLEASTRRLMQGRTVFRADQIVVLEGGQIVETGTHGELLAENGAYAEMVKAYQVESQKSHTRRQLR